MAKGMDIKEGSRAAAEYLGISEAAVSRFAMQGQLLSFHHGGVRVFYQQDLDAFMETPAYRLHKEDTGAHGANRPRLWKARVACHYKFPNGTHELKTHVVSVRAADRKAALQEAEMWTDEYLVVKEVKSIK